MSTPNLKLIPAFIEKAVINAFNIQIASKISATNKSMGTDLLEKHSIDCISSLIMNSNEYVGSIVLAFPKKTFLNIVERMLGETHTEITPETSDASGELLNIIYSSSRKDINEQGFSFGMSIPSTIIGSNLNISKSNLSGTLLFIEFNGDIGPFLFVLSLEKQKNSNVA